MGKIRCYSFILLAILNDRTQLLRVRSTHTRTYVHRCGCCIHNTYIRVSHTQTELMCQYRFGRSVFCTHILQGRCPSVRLFYNQPFVPADTFICHKFSKLITTEDRQTDRHTVLWHYGGRLYSYVTRRTRICIFIRASYR